MYYKRYFKVVGIVLLGFALSLLLPFFGLLLSVHSPSEEHPQPHSSLAFLAALVFAQALALYYFILAKIPRAIFIGERLFLQSLVWVLIPVFWRAALSF